MTRTYRFFVSVRIEDTDTLPTLDDVREEVQSLVEDCDNHEFHTRVVPLDMSWGSVRAECGETPVVRQTSCRHCGLDVEGFGPFTAKTVWRDRGNNTRCNDNKHTHKGVL